MPRIARPRRAQIEQSLQHRCIDFWRIAVLQGPGVPMLIAIPNGEARDPVTAAKLVGISAEQRAYLPEHERLSPFGLGVVPGVYDLLLILPGGRVWWIELKRPKDALRGQAAGRMGHQQLLFATRMSELSHRHAVVESVDEFATVLEQAGIKLRVRWWGPEVVRPGQPPRLPPDPAPAPAAPPAAPHPSR